VPAEYMDWIERKVKGRTTTLSFNSITSEPATLNRGIDHGCPLLGILFQFYNVDLIDGYDPRGVRQQSPSWTMPCC